MANVCRKLTVFRLGLSKIFMMYCSRIGPSFSQFKLLGFLADSLKNYELIGGCNKVTFLKD